VWIVDTFGNAVNLNTGMRLVVGGSDREGFGVSVRYLEVAPITALVRNKKTEYECHPYITGMVEKLNANANDVLQAKVDLLMQEVAALASDLLKMQQGTERRFSEVTDR
jgi:hypothetical protein